MRPQTKLTATIPSLRDSVFDSNFKITCSVQSDSVDVWLHGIVGDEYTQTDSASISKVLMSNRGKPLNLYVNSPGGLAYDGIAAIGALVKQGKSDALTSAALTQGAGFQGTGGVFRLLPNGYHVACCCSQCFLLFQTLGF